MHGRRKQLDSTVGSLAVVLFMALTVFSLGCGEAPPPANEKRDASGFLAEVVEAAWSYALERSPRVRLQEGLPVEKLWDVTFEGAKSDVAAGRELLDFLAWVDVDALSHEEVLTYEILKWQLETDGEGLEYFWHDSVVTPYASIGRGLSSLFGALPVATAADRDRYFNLVAQVPKLVNDLHERVEGQVERGIFASRQAMPKVLALTASFIQPGEASLFQISAERLEGVGEEEADDFRQDIAELVEEEINPAWQRLHDDLAGDYQARTTDEVGAKRLPGGKAYYRYLTRVSTTFDVSPEEVREVGFELVAEMEEEMARIQAEVGFEGTREEFHRHLRSDSKFFPETPEEVGEKIQAAADAFFARSSDYFLATPRAPYGVRRLDPRLEGSMTYGYYEPPNPSEPSGFYFFNGSKLNERSLLNLEGLAYHELVPGHHFHISRQTENESLPDFRRYLYPTAFTEGWGSYSTYLGLETGLLRDPYSRYGVYMLEIFLANRLVVDPGMNFFGWPLERARDYMRDHTLESETQIATETLRYSTDIPAQALAYQMGKRKILELREKARAALGERFDIREFHEAVLGSGAMPLSVLEKHVDWFIEQQLR